MTNAGLDELLERWDDANEAGQELTPEELCRDCPEYLTEVRQQIAALRAVDRRLGGPAPAGDARYRALHVLARGGLGEVYLAEDERLHRTVALKRIRPRLAGDAGYSGRFRREAEITARLQHPGVVPVYDLTAGADGQPSYVMRFVEGETLDAAIARLAPGPPGVEFRTLLTRFVSVCNTVAYGHAQGVVHRDLKPANILLGRFGETVVVDWGLAKEIRSSPADAETKVDPEAGPQAVGSGAHPTPPAADETQPGAVLGTPAYMSPEQAAGAEVGPASDVYSLGATLYHLLTGRPPLGGEWPVLRERLLRGDIPRPRQVRPDVPRALEAVCLRAMATVPADRYAAPLELARELEQWLAGEPVAAWREPWTLRAARWARRHRTLVTSAAAVLAVSALALGAGLAAVEVQRREATRQRDVALEQKRRARQALDFVTSREALSTLMAQEQVLPQQAAFLREALRHYEDFAREQPTDEEGRALLLNAHHHVGYLALKLGQMDEAETAYRAAVDIADGLVADFPDRPVYRKDLAGAVNNLANVLNTQNRGPEVAALERRAMAERERLVRDYPAEPAYRVDLASSRHNYATTLVHRGDADNAIQLLEASIADRTAVASTRPGDDENRRELAATRSVLANILCERGREADALPLLAAAQEGLEQLTKANPAQWIARQHLVHVFKNRAGALQNLGRAAEALADYQRAEQVAGRLAADFPATPRHRFVQAICLRLIGELQRERRQFRAAEAAFDGSLAVLGRLRDHYPANAQYADEWAAGHNDRGCLYVDIGRYAEAEAAFRAVLGVYEERLRRDPGHTEHRVDCGGVRCNIGDVLRQSGQPAAALEWYDRAAEDVEPAYRADPKDRINREYLGNIRAGRAQALATLGRAAEALAGADEALPLVAPPVRPLVTLTRADALVTLGRKEEAVALADRVATGSPDVDEVLYQSAAVLARAAPSADDALAGRAAERLIQAADKGFADATRLRRDERFAAVRSRADVVRLLARLDAATPANRQ